VQQGALSFEHGLVGVRQRQQGRMGGAPHRAGKIKIEIGHGMIDTERTFFAS
jgi:hypothetical protein